MLVKYIDSNYIIERLQKPSWGEVEEPDFYITMASNRVKTLIFPAEQGDPNNLESYTEEQQEAIKLATAIYTLWYFDTNYDFTNGSVSVNFGGVSMSESKTYNGEMVLPNVFDILKQANLIPTTETFIFSGENNLYADVAINPKAFKDLQQEVERQADQNIKQDAKIVNLYDEIANLGAFDIPKFNEEIIKLQEEQKAQNENITNNFNNINTTKTDLGDLGNQVIDVHNKTTENTNNITQNREQIGQTRELLNKTIDALKKHKLISYKGTYIPGETYKIGDLVILNNVFYLSNADNNTTTPPGEFWNVIEDPAAGKIDLTNYYNKLEIDSKVIAINNDMNNKVSKTNNETIDGDKTFNGLTTFNKEVFFENYAAFSGEINALDTTNIRFLYAGDILRIGTNKDYYYSASETNRKLQRLINTPITDPKELITKEYVDNAIAPLLEYAKTGILRWYVVNFETGRWAIEWAQKPLGWNDSWTIERIHLSTYYTNNGFVEFIEEGVQEWLNVRIRAEANSSKLNNNIWKDVNKDTRVYLYINWGDKVDAKFREIKMCIPSGFRYEKYGISVYIPIKLK